MEIKILGTGCPKCQTLERNTREAVSNLEIDASISKVEDIVDIMAYGVARTPGLVIDGNVVSSGRLLSASQIERLLNK